MVFKEYLLWLLKITVMLYRLMHRDTVFLLPEINMQLKLE